MVIEINNWLECFNAVAAIVVGVVVVTAACWCYYLHHGQTLHEIFSNLIHLKGGCLLLLKLLFHHNGSVTCESNIKVGIEESLILIVSKYLNCGLFFTVVQFTESGFCDPFR
jgi:hypothetical protein